MIIRDKIASLCEQFQYPAFIETLIRKCCAVFERVTPSSVVLIGSAARGELSWFKRGKRQELISDLEFLVFLFKKLKKNQHNKLCSLLSEISAHTPFANPLFHIDFALVLRTKAHRIKRNLASFEMRAVGKTILGNESDLMQLPEINLKNLDLTALNQLVFVRLWWLLAGIPKQVIEGQATEYSDFLFRYVACRNLLDIPTILLPNNGYLIAGYAERSRFLEANYFSLPAAEYMGQHFAKYIAQSLREKLNMNFQDSSFLGYAKTIDLYICLIRYLLRALPETSVAELWDKLASERTLFDSSLISRQMLHMAITRSGKKAPWNLFSNLKRVVLPIGSIIIAILMSMHWALINLLQGSEMTASEWLDKASALLSRISPIERSINAGSIAERWLSLRYAIARTMCDLFSTFNLRHRFIEDMISWTDTTEHSHG